MERIGGAKSSQQTCGKRDRKQEEDRREIIGRQKGISTDKGSGQQRLPKGGEGAGWSPKVIK